MIEQIQRRRPATLVGCLALLWLLLAVVCSLGAWVGQRLFGHPGFVAATAAAIVCGVAASLALASVAVFRGPSAALIALLFGMFFRMGLPLGAGMLLSGASRQLADAGVFGFILVFYLFTLVVETWLSLRLTASAKSGPVAG